MQIRESLPSLGAGILKIREIPTAILIRSTNSKPLEKILATVYFYTPPVESDPQQTMYPHTAIALCEGLAELGFSLYAPRPYWRTSAQTNETLFKHDPDVTADDCDIVIFDSGMIQFHDGLEFILNLKPNSTQVRVLTHHTDQSSLDQHRLVTLYPKRFDLILSAHRCVDQKLPSNVKPWALGLSKRQLRELSHIPPFDQRERTLRYNFRHVGKMQSVRKAAQDLFYPISDAALPASFSAMGMPEEAYHHLMWKQTGRRHTPVFYEELMSVMATASFCGWFIPSWPRSQANPLFVLMWRLMRRFDLKGRRITQWDSWRFWEAMAAGCVSIHADFDKYGMALPVRPTNWEHYIGIDFDRAQDAIDRIVAEPAVLDRISVQGRAWVLDHYSPVPVAERFLRLIGQEAPRAAGSATLERRMVSARR